MNKEEAIKMIKAKLECMTRDVSGRDCDCIDRRCDECSLNYEQGNMGEQKEWLRMSIEALEQQPRWIPTSERLPEKDTYVLATTRWGEVTIAEMYSENDWFIHEGATNVETDEIVAWMPLPPSYKAESEE